VRIANLKKAGVEGDLCADLPDEFQLYFNYVSELQFDQDPDYDFMRGLFRGLFLRQGYESDNCYDWTKKKKSPLISDI